MMRTVYLFAFCLVLWLTPFAGDDALAACYTCSANNIANCASLSQGSGRTECTPGFGGSACQLFGNSCAAAGGGGCTRICCPCYPDGQLIVPNGERASRWARGERGVNAATGARCSPSAPSRTSEPAAQLRKVTVATPAPGQAHITF
jgi:hypothetical protein